MNNKNILILTPSLENSGGVANYYNILKSKLSFDHEFFVVGKREAEHHDAPQRSHILRLISDYISFIRLLWGSNHNLVLINPSLNFNGFNRDYIFYLISRLFRKKTIVFFRGWDDGYAQTVFSGRLRFLFRPLLRSDGFIVLANQFKDIIAPHLKSSRIFVDTTVFDERMLPQGYESLFQLKNPEKRIRMLFLSRIEADKGVYESIAAYKNRRKKNIDVELIIAGSGSEANNVRQLVEEYGDENLRYVGRIGGHEKTEALLSSSVLLFPSMHAEGMPNTVLEAMGCGLAVIATKVGGMNDFFVGESMGAELTNDLTAEIEAAVTGLNNDRELLHTVSMFNYNFAKKYFYSERIVERLNNIIDGVLFDRKCSDSWIKYHAPPRVEITSDPCQ